MSDPRKEDILDLLNKTWSPCCSTALGVGQLTAFGNTPPVDLFKDLDMGKKLDVLLMQQADLRHIMKTIAAMNHYKDGIERKSVPDEITIRFVDNPTSIARNAMIFEFLDTIEDKSEDMELLWNIWFNCSLTSTDYSRLSRTVNCLGEDDKETEPKRKWKFVDKNTDWKAWDVLERCIYSEDHLSEHRDVFDNKGLFTFDRHTKQDPDVSRRYATKWPYKKFEKFQNEVKTWNKYGVLDVGHGVTEDADWPNPLMYRRGDVYIAVQRDLCPFATFCPIESDGNELDSSLTEACFTEFVEIVKDFREMLKRVKVHIDFEVGDTLEYLSTHKDMKYDLIHTSNMADVYGLTNTLLCCGPLMKQENSVLITTTEEHVYVPRKDYITAQTGCSVNMLPTFLGVQMAENLSLGQNFIGKDSPVQTYRWVKCPEEDSVKVSLIDSPELVGNSRTFFTVFSSSDFCSAMSLATAFKRFQERITDSPDFIMDNIMKDILPKPYLKSFLLVCKILGIFASKPLRIVKATLDAAYFDITGGCSSEETIYKTEKLFLVQPSLFSSFITDKYQTDTYYCDTSWDTIIVLMEEEDYDKMLEYNINCASQPNDNPHLSKIVQEKAVIELDEVKPEVRKKEEVFVRERTEAYIVTLDYKGDLVYGSPTVVFDEKPCRVTANFTDSNGEMKIPLTLNCRLTNEFHDISVDKSTRQINLTIYKECLQKQGTHLLPLSIIDFDSAKPCLDVKNEALGILNELKIRIELFPKLTLENYTDFTLLRYFMQDKVLKKSLDKTENVVRMRSITNEQVFIKFDQIYIVDGYPLVDITFYITKDDEKKAAKFMKKAAQNGWKISKNLLGAKRVNMFNTLKMLLFMNSRRIPQSSSSEMPECYRSFLDLRFSDFDMREIPKSKVDTLHSNFHGSAQRLDAPGLYGRCCYCMKLGTELLLCDHCEGRAYYCDDDCMSADFKRHDDIVNGRLPIDKKEPEKNTTKNKCKACGQMTTTAKACSQCKEVYYCDRKCQGKDWGNHKGSCKKPTQISIDPNLKKNLLRAFGAKQQSNGKGEAETCSSKDNAGGDFKVGSNSQGKDIEGKLQENMNKHNIDAAGDFNTSSAQPELANHDADININQNTKSASEIHINDVDSDVIQKGAKRLKTEKQNNISAEANSKSDEPESSSTSRFASSSVHCANCKGHASSTLTCTVCSTVKYCGYQCQLTHWPHHHKQCVKHLLLKLGAQL